MHWTARTVFLLGFLGVLYLVLVMFTTVYRQDHQPRCTCQEQSNEH
jgi:hypothetical protein